MIPELQRYFERDSQSRVGTIVHSDHVLVESIVHADLQIDVDVLDPDWQVNGRRFHVDGDLVVKQINTLVSGVWRSLTSSADINLPPASFRHRT